MKIFICFLGFLSVIVSINTLVGCSHKSIPATAPSSARLEVDTTIILWSAMGRIGGSGYYCKTAYWGEMVRFNPLLGDSVLKMLLDSNYAVVEFWYPETASMCLDPSVHEREITKLEQSDTAICRLGYAPLDSGYSDVCIRYWRHYKIRRVQGIP
jgi:hypothetical protein